MQIKVADAEMTGSIQKQFAQQEQPVKWAEFLRIGNSINTSDQWFHKTILKASQRYSPRVKEDMVLLLEAFLSISDPTTASSLKNRNYQVCAKTGLREIWLVYPRISYKVFP